MTPPPPAVAPIAQRPPDAGAILGRTALAGAMIAYGMRRRGVVGFTAGVAGAALLAALIAQRLAPADSAAGRPVRPVDVDGSFLVGRSASDVFAFFRNFEHLTLLSDLLDSVEDFDDGRSRWRIAARDGTLLEWDVIVTKYVPSRVIAWESVGDGPIESHGTVRFHAVDEDVTRVDLTLQYAPRTEAAARALRPFASRGPERRMRAAIGRIETAMQKAAQPGFYDRAPLHPLPDITATD